MGLLGRVAGDMRLPAPLLGEHVAKFLQPALQKQGKLVPIEADDVDTDAALAVLRGKLLTLDRAEATDKLLVYAIQSAFHDFVRVEIAGPPLNYNDDGDMEAVFLNAYVDANEDRPVVHVRMRPGCGRAVRDFGEHDAWWRVFVRRFKSILVHERTHQQQHERLHRDLRQRDSEADTHAQVNQIYRDYNSTSDDAYLAHQGEISAFARQAVQEFRSRGKTDDEIRAICKQVHNPFSGTPEGNLSKAFARYRIMRFKNPPVWKAFLRNVVRALDLTAGQPKESALWRTAMTVTVPPAMLDHFWEEPGQGDEEFWALRWPIRAQVGDKITFKLEGKPIAEATISRIEKPGESDCSTTGRYKNMWKAFWTNGSFRKL